MRAMWRNAWEDHVVSLPIADEPFGIGKILIQGRGRHSREVDYSGSETSPHAQRPGCPGRAISEKVHVVVSGYTCFKHFETCKLGCIVNKFGREPLGLSRPDMLFEPFPERQVVS